jgi:hypothetical protein
MTGNKSKNRQIGLYQTEKLLYSKGYNSVDRKFTGVKKLFANQLSDKVIISWIYKKFKTFNNRETNNLI